MTLRTKMVKSAMVGALIVAFSVISVRLFGAVDAVVSFIFLAIVSSVVLQLRRTILYISGYRTPGVD